MTKKKARGARRPVRGRAAGLLREIARRETSPAEIAAREAHQRGLAEQREMLRAAAVERLVPVVEEVLGVDARPGQARRIATAVLDELRGR